MLKDTVKNYLGSYYSIFNYPIIVNSYGRSGSTVLKKSIIQSSIKAKNKKIQDIAFRSISQSAWDLNTTSFECGIVYKTHDYPPVSDFNNHVRMIYTFADPVDVVLSLLRLYNERGEEWIKEHYDHLKVSYTNFQDIIRKDQLHLEKHLDAWLEEQRFPIAFIKYESMWDHQEDISNFLGFNVHLPPFKKRKFKKNQELTPKIEKTYTPLRKKIDELDSFFIKNCTNK